MLKPLPPRVDMQRKARSPETEGAALRGIGARPHEAV